MQYTDKYRSPLGEITLASDGDHLTGLWFDGQKYFAATLSAEHQERELPIFEQAKEWLGRYFMGKNPQQPLITHYGAIQQNLIRRVL